MGIFSFRRSYFDAVEKYLLKNGKLSDSQRNLISFFKKDCNPGEIIYSVPALPEELCHMQMAEVVPESGQYTLKIDCRIVEDKKLVSKKILPTATVYVVCDVIGRQLNMDDLRMPELMGLPISNKSIGHMHTVIRIAEAVL